MVESILHLFKIHREMIFGNPSVIVQNMFSKTPKTFNTVDMILASVSKRFAVIQAMMFAQSFQRVVASEGIRVIHRPFSRFLPDDRHELLFRYMLYDPRIHLAIALQKAKNNVFTSGTPSALAFPSATEVALVHFHFAVQPAALKFGHMVNHFSELLIDARNRLVVGAEVMREAVCRLLLVKPLHNSNLHSDSLQGLLFSTAFVPAPDVSPTCLRDLERTAEHTLLSPQKVGRATKNILSPLCHMDILLPYGYETP